MAAASSHRSPSPISGRRSPNLRTPENSNNIRKSFNGNPIARPSISAVPRGFNPVTPVNSPADFPQRNLISKEGMSAVRASYEKENEKDRNCSKPIRAKSPVFSMGTKNFMAPTISAASKIAPSPRKKVLTERNETVRTSLASHSEGKSLFPCMNSSEIEETKEIESKSEMGLDSQVTSDYPKVLEVSFGPRTVEHECNEHLGSSFASPDIDPPIPPYDPKTNYLSPRPMFLRYKPNRRIEVFLNKEKDFDPVEASKQPEDSFTSESCLDYTEPTDETESPITQKDSDCLFPSEVEDKDDDKETHVSDPESDISDAVTEKSMEESVEVKQIPHYRSFARPKFMSFLLVLAIACLSISVTDSPVVLSPLLIKNQPFHKLYAQSLQVLEDPHLRDSIAEIGEIANVNLERVVYSFKRLSIKSVAYLLNAMSLPREEDTVPLRFVNLTIPVSDINANEMLADANQIKDFRERKNEVIGLELEMEGEVGQAANEELGEMEGEIEQAATMVLEEESGLVLEMEGEIEQAGSKEHFHLEIDSKETTENEVTEEPINVVLEEQPLPVSQARKIEHEFVETDEIQEKFTIDSHTSTNPLDAEITQNPDSWTDIETPHSLDVIDPTNYGPVEDEFPIRNTSVVSLIVLALMTIAACFHLKQNKASKVPNAVVKKVPNAVVKKMDSADLLVSASVSASSDSGPCFDRTPFHQNGPAEVDMAGDSGPYEVSSSLQKSSSCNLRRSERGETEVQSYERKSRRSSNNSSSESPSYGSFTIYEKLHSKQGFGDDEAMTPVRRSSRLRKQITSP
ncbi:uncharacterized protein LOC131218804 [Magnolia sinica]|uniref:uncharacterized protein LOC131218804 n=1 Tax=Magnolia sinica TaxID=86752 RepID=UPI00265A6CE5|nr:uncharacterized protein LOC131218804 [Magnolia sinica]